MISKSQKVVIVSMFGILLLLSVAGLAFAFITHAVTPMIISDSSLELSSKVSDEERARILRLAQEPVLHVSVVLSILTGLWAAFAGSIVWILSRDSKT